MDLLIATKQAETMPGGLLRYRQGLTEQMRRRGFSVAACSADDGTVEFAPSGETRKLPPCREARRPWMSLASRPPLHGLLPPWISGVYRPMTRELARFRPATIHFIGTGWDFFGFAMQDLARRCGARFTVWPAVHPGQWGDDRIDIRFYQRAETVFCQSRHEANHLEKRGVATDRLLVSGLPPMCRPDGDGAGFRRRHQLGTRPAVLFVGRREEEKGYPALLRAWTDVAARRPEAVLILAGPGAPLPHSAPVRSVIDLGVPDETEIAAAYAAATTVCLPSHHESFGIVYAEAWSYAKPVVCGTAPAPREWIEDGITGLWTDGRPSDIAEKLLRLLDETSLGDGMGRAGQTLQRQRLNWDAVTDLHLEAFGLPSHAV